MIAIWRRKNKPNKPNLPNPHGLSYFCELRLHAKFQLPRSRLSCISMKEEDSLTWISNSLLNTNIFTISENTNIKYIHIKTTNRMWISNIFVSSKTEYEFWILNIFVRETWPNRNIDYVQCKLLMTPSPMKWISNKFWCIFMLVYEEFLLSVDHIAKKEHT